MPLQGAFASKDAPNPFVEQLEFFRKKLNLPTKRYDDIVKQAHDRAFIVAGAANADLLNDLHAAIAARMEDGKGLEAFRKDFKAIVQKHGWTGWTGEGSKAGQAWRTRIIYQTNMATSYAAGRWKQLTEPAFLATRPYWKYMHADGVMHPRPLHVSWNGLVLPYDHPFWKTHFPPNGWCCHCYIVAVTKVEYEAAKAAGRAEPPPGWDSIDMKSGAPVGIDKGFDYAPGANADRPLKEFIDEKLINVYGPIGSAMYDPMRPTLQAELVAEYGEFLAAVLADPVKRGRMTIVGAIDPETMSWLQTNKGIVPATAEIAVQDGLIVGKKALRHQVAGDALTAEEWASLPDMLASAEQILYDTTTGKLLYIGPGDAPDAPKLAVEFDYLVKKPKGEVNMLVSAFKVLKNTVAGWVKGGGYEVVK